MNDQEMVERIQEISKELESYPEAETPPTKEERNHKQVLLMERDILKRIQIARENGNWQQEMRGRIDHALLTSIGEKHPFLMYLVRSQSGWNFF